MIYKLPHPQLALIFLCESFVHMEAAEFALRTDPSPLSDQNQDGLGMPLKWNAIDNI